MIYNGKPIVSENGETITYDCSSSRPVGTIGDIRKVTSLSQNTGYYYADDYEIVGSSGGDVTYRLKSKEKPITQVSVTSANAPTSIPNIVANYPYTCKQTSSNGTCNTLYKVDSYISGTNCYAYDSTQRSTIGYSAFNTNTNYSISNVGYMYNEQYNRFSGKFANNAVYGKNIEWNGTSYLVIEDTSGVASTNTTLDATHHYTCDSVGITTCTTVRFYYASNYYIKLTNGDTIEDALYKMTGNGSEQVKNKNIGYKLNNTDSTIKTALETWFRKYLTNEENGNNLNYQQYLEDTIFCGDRSFKLTGDNSYANSGWNPNGGDLTKSIYFAPWNKYNNNYSTTVVPSVSCPNETDQFSVHNIKAKLNYPVGLLTADEIIMAGARGLSLDSGGVGLSENSEENHYYLNNDDLWWTISASTNNTVFYVFMDYDFNGGGSAPNTTSGVRPVVSLKHDTEFAVGGDGTATNPYIVKYN